MFQVLKAEDQKEKEELTGKWVEAVKKEVEPLLKDAGPFFGGSGRMTLAEVSSELFPCVGLAEATNFGRLCARA